MNTYNFRAVGFGTSPIQLAIKFNKIKYNLNGATELKASPRKRLTTEMPEKKRTHKTNLMSSSLIKKINFKIVLALI